MKLTEDFRQTVVSVGKEALEITAHDGEFFHPKLLVEMNGELTVMSYPAKFEELQALTAYLVGLNTPITGVCLTVDTFYYVSVEGESEKDAAAKYVGRLQEMFLAGDKRVTEALTIHCVSIDESAMITVPYTRHGDRIEWLDTLVSDGESVTGRFPDLLRKLIEETQS